MDKEVSIERQEEDAFTSEPSAERARRFAISFRAHMLDHLLQAVQIAEEGLGKSLSPLRQRIETLDPRGALGPSAFVGLTRLTEALSSGNVTRVTDAVHALHNTPQDEWTDARFRVESMLTEPWEMPFVQNTRGQEVEGSEADERIMRPILDADPGPSFRPVAEALAVMRRVDPDLADEFQELVTRVKLFVGAGFLGLSSPAAFGAVYIRLPDANPLIYFLEHLVHEQSHLFLNTLMALDPLIENPMDEVPAPLRPGPRPLFQAFHATFVLGRNVRFGRRLVSDPAHCAFVPWLEGLEQKFAEGHATVSRSARFTPSGQRVFDSLEKPVS